MGDLMLKGLSEDVMARLSQRAADHGRTVEAEAAEIVTLELARAREADWLERAAAARRETGRLSVSTLDLLHESRDEMR